MCRFFSSMDTALFYAINHGLENKFLDIIMPIITDIGYWEIPLLAAWLCLMIFGGKKGRITGIVLVVSIILIDLFNSYPLKFLFARPRPCNVLLDVRTLVSTSTTYSFPSSHATNIFALATILSNKYRSFRFYFFSVALVVGTSRIYVGVHYPFDVLAGAVVGILCGLGALKLEKYILQRFEVVQ
ncbi:phosphatase PAP2 family protein [bacterium]|nr:phosphatase PAP2 family protein [bacterium]